MGKDKAVVPEEFLKIKELCFLLIIKEILCISYCTKQQQ